MQYNEMVAWVAGFSEVQPEALGPLCQFVACLTGGGLTEDVVRDVQAYRRRSVLATPAQEITQDIAGFAAAKDFPRPMGVLSAEAQRDNSK